MANLRVNQLETSGDLQGADQLPVEIAGPNTLRRSTVNNLAKAMGRIMVDIPAGTAPTGPSGGSDGWTVGVLQVAIEDSFVLDCSAVYNLFYSGSTFGGGVVGDATTAGVVIHSVYYKDRLTNSAGNFGEAPILSTHGDEYSVYVDFIIDADEDTVTVVIRPESYFGSVQPAFHGYIDYNVYTREVVGF